MFSGLMTEVVVFGLRKEINSGATCFVCLQTIAGYSNLILVVPKVGGAYRKIGAIRMVIWSCDDKFIIGAAEKTLLVCFFEIEYIF